MSFENPNLDSTKEKFTPKYSAKYYEGVEGSTDINDDSRFIQILQEKCLEFLKAREVEFKDQGGTHFFKEYPGELAPSGYLLDINGKETNELPSQNIAGDIIKLEQEAVRDFIAMYPEDADKLELRGQKIVNG
jgi:hypothetical protein